MSVSNVVWLPAFSFLQMNLIYVLPTIFCLFFFLHFSVRRIEYYIFVLPHFTQQGFFTIVLKLKGQSKKKQKIRFMIMKDYWNHSWKKFENRQLSLGGTPS